MNTLFHLWGTVSVTTYPSSGFLPLGVVRWHNIPCVDLRITLERGGEKGFADDYEELTQSQTPTIQDCAHECLQRASKSPQCLGIAYADGARAGDCRILTQLATTAVDPDPLWNAYSISSPGMWLIG